MKAAKLFVPHTHIQTCMHTQVPAECRGSWVVTSDPSQLASDSLSRGIKDGKVKT